MAATIVAATTFLPSIADNYQQYRRKLPMAKDEMKLSDTLSEADANKYDSKFLESVIMQNADNNDSAMALLKECLQMKPDAAEAHYEIAALYQQQNKDSLAAIHLEKAAKLQPENDTYQESLARYFLSVKKYGEAIKVYENLAERQHDRTDILNILLQLYENDKEYKKMIPVINRIEQIEGSSEDITLSKMRVYDLLGDKKAAYRALKNLSDEHPNDVNYKVMRGNWLLQHDKKNEALKLFHEAQKEDPENLYTLSSLADYYMESGDTLNANILTLKMLVSKNTPSKTKISLLQNVIKDNEQYHGGDSTKVLATFDKIIEANPKDADIMQLKAAYMELKKMPADTIDVVLRQALRIAPDAVSARLHIIETLWSKQKWDEIIALCKPGVQYNPEEMVFYYFMGLSHYQKQENDLALDAFRRGVDEINAESNPDFVSDFYAIMGDILHQKGQSQEAFAAYDSCLQWKADNIGCLNNYAYYLSERGENLEKAEQMSYKTIKAEPKNSTYLDTYAWILYMQKRYADAQIYADQAVACDTDSVQSAVILEHTGDIHNMAGDRKGAMEYWQKAIKAGGDKAAISRKINPAATQDKKKKQKK